MSVATRPDVLGLAGTTADSLRFDACIDVAGFWVVYRGHLTSTDQPVAIKCLRLPRGDSDLQKTIAARFAAEGPRLGELGRGSADIVRWISSGELFAPATGEHLVYVAYEWIDGQPLSRDLEEHRQGRSLAEAMDLMESAALALAHAHAAGVVHRSFEPRNLMVVKTQDHRQRLRVLDFGVAEILARVKDDFAPTSGQTRMTGDGVYACSPAYAAPEQFTDRVGTVGTWTDVYSFVLVLYEVLRGQRVRNVKSINEGLAYSVNPKTGSPRASSLGIQLPPAVEDLLARAVSVQPNQRPETLGALWTSLRELVRQSMPPVSDVSALAATAMDNSATASALEKARAMASKQVTAPMKSGEAPKSFTGTMLMEGANLKALAHGHAPQPEPPTTTEPLAMPVSPNAMTMGVMSPLAASFGPGIRSPVAVPAPGSVPPSILSPPTPAGPSSFLASPPQAQTPNPARPPSSPNGGQLLPPHLLERPAQPASVPPPSQLPPSQLPPSQSQQPVLTLEPTRGSGWIVAILVTLVIAVATAAGILYLFRRS